MSARGVRPPKKEVIRFLYASIQICFFSASFLLLLRCYFEEMHLLCVTTICRASRALCSFMQTRHPKKNPPAGPQFVRPSERPGAFWKAICPPKSTASGALRATFCPPNRTASDATIGVLAESAQAVPPSASASAAPSSKANHAGGQGCGQHQLKHQQSSTALLNLAAFRGVS
jgi:hypothetical protein